MNGILIVLNGDLIIGAPGFMTSGFSVFAGLLVWGDGAASAGGGFWGEEFCVSLPD